MNQLKQSIRAFIQMIPPQLKNKYALTLFIFFLWLIVFDTNTLPSQVRLNMQIEEMHDKKAYYKNEIEVVNQALEDLLTDENTQEKFARENYLMKKKNEDVFVIEYK